MRVLQIFCSSQGLLNDCYKLQNRTTWALCNGCLGKGGEGELSWSPSWPPSWPKWVYSAEVCLRRRARPIQSVHFILHSFVNKHFQLKLVCTIQWLIVYVMLSRLRSLSQMKSVNLTTKVRELIERGPPEDLVANFHKLFGDKMEATKFVRSQFCSPDPLKYCPHWFAVPFPHSICSEAYRTHF